ncbi:MAG: YrhB family protein [Proteobacteria bacterium]|nr:YrhB family protein [Pseudomonadota bacterium]
MNEKQATRIAQEYVAQQSAAAGRDFVLVHELTLSKQYGWVFFYDTRAYVEGGDELRAAVGNAPFIVLAENGEIHSTGTAHDVDHYLALFERHGTCHPSD